MKTFLASLVAAFMLIGFSYTTNACDKDGKCVGKSSASCCSKKTSCSSKASCSSKSSAAKADVKAEKTEPAKEEKVSETPSTK